jgi:hypothetical protein
VTLVFSEVVYASVSEDRDTGKSKGVGIVQVGDQGTAMEKKGIINYSVPSFFFFVTRATDKSQITPSPPCQN